MDCRAIQQVPFILGYNVSKRKKLAQSSNSRKQLWRHLCSVTLSAREGQFFEKCERRLHKRKETIHMATSLQDTLPYHFIFPIFWGTKTKYLGTLSFLDGCKPTYIKVAAKSPKNTTVNSSLQEKPSESYVHNQHRHVCAVYVGLLNEKWTHVPIINYS